MTSKLFESNLRDKADLVDEKPIFFFIQNVYQFGCYVFQVMSTGPGIEHSEMNTSQEKKAKTFHSIGIS